MKQKPMPRASWVLAAWMVSGLMSILVYLSLWNIFLLVFTLLVLFHIADRQDKDNGGG